jgi:polyhydroxyalkanoate synthase subunit PhaC
MAGKQRIAVPSDKARIGSQSGSASLRAVAASGDLQDSSLEKLLYGCRLVQLPVIQQGAQDTSGSKASSSIKKTPYGALEQTFKSALARMTLGITPAGLASAGYEWLTHLVLSPGKQLELTALGVGQSAVATRNFPVAAKAPFSTERRPHDRRFEHPGWQLWPFNALYQGYLTQNQWWRAATTRIDGLSPRTESVVAFVARQILDAASPSNLPWTNPEVVQATFQQGGANLLHGANNAMHDWATYLSGRSPAATKRGELGKTVAATPGSVVYQNRLIELIQYRPATDTVYAEPILIIPAWIMKYYILDLSPGRSLVEYLVGRGHTVFILSWKNPGVEDRDLGMSGYQRLGVMAALDAVSAIVPDRKVHTAGYCLGGTLLAIAAATMGRDGDDRLASLTLLAAQTDFADAGELGLFISESEVSYLEHMMSDQGYLGTRQMAAVFHMLRANELIWSRLVRDYFLGRRTPTDDLTAWSADLTRMPCRMHSQYLRHLFLGNDLAAGRYVVDGRPISLGDIRVTSFAVGTVQDHVSPWHSVHKIHLQACREVTFVLSRGGHNTGIVSPPGHPRAQFQVRTRKPLEPYVDPETWRAETPDTRGSWWPTWQEWLAQRSSARVAPPPTGLRNGPYRIRRPAPGRYIHQR